MSVINELFNVLNRAKDLIQPSDTVQVEELNIKGLAFTDDMSTVEKQAFDSAIKKLLPGVGVSRYSIDLAKKTLGNIMDTIDYREFGHEPPSVNWPTNVLLGVTTASFPNQIEGSMVFTPIMRQNFPQIGGMHNALHHVAGPILVGNRNESRLQEFISVLHNPGRSHRFFDITVSRLSNIRRASTNPETYYAVIESSNPDAVVADIKTVVNQGFGDIELVVSVGAVHIKGESINDIRFADPGIHWVPEKEYKPYEETKYPASS